MTTGTDPGFTRLELPPFYCPFPVSTHPHLAAAEVGTVDFMDEFGLYWTPTQRRRLIDAECGRLAAILYPYGSNELLQVSSDYMLWAFAYDDEYCDEGPTSLRPAEHIVASSRMQRAIESPDLPIDESDRYAMAIRDIRRRLDRYASPLVGRRFAEWQRGYFWIEMWKQVSTQPSLNDYVIHRLYGGGGMTFPTFACIVPNLEVTEAELADHRFSAVLEMAATLGTWDSDFFSYTKERARSRSKGHNLVATIMREFSCSPQDAVEIGTDYRNRVMGLYLRLSRDVARQASQGLTDYITGLDHYVSGGLAWYCSNKRYNSTSGTGGGARTFVGGDLTEDPPAALDNAEPLPIPSIAWWWQHDPGRSHRTSPNRGA